MSTWLKLCLAGAILVVSVAAATVAVGPGRFLAVVSRLPTHGSSRASSSPGRPPTR